MNKAKLFAMNFTSNSSLDDKDHLLLDFPYIIEYKLHDISTSAWEVSKLIKSHEATCPDKIPVVLKNLDSELPPILAKLFNCCLK